MMLSQDFNRTETQVLTHMLTATGLDPLGALYRYCTVHSRTPFHHQYMGYACTRTVRKCQYDVRELCMFDFAVDI